MILCLSKADRKENLKLILNKMEAPEQDFGKQNKIILNILRSGGSINRIEAIRIGITALNSRVSDLKHKHKIEGIVGVWEKGSKCKRYSLVGENK